MRPVSERFLRTVRGSHTMTARARVVVPGQTGTDPTGTVIPILGGDVQLNGRADVRSALQLTTEGSLWPIWASDPLAPYGNEVFVERGVQYGNGVTEWVSLGYHRINTPEQDDAPDGPIIIQAQDRMSGIVDGRLPAPIQFPATMTFGAITAQLVTDIYPSAVIEWDDLAVRDRQVGRATIAEQDRYGYLRDLWDSLGKIAYWDHRGILVIKSPPDASSPVAEISHGQDGVLVFLSRRLTREGVHNAIVATGEGADAASPVRAVAVDSSPNSPTYWHGPFGKAPLFYSSPLITTADQARTAARSMLARELGLPYAVDFGVVPNPALEPDDPVRVRYPGRSEVHVIDRLSVPLTAAGAMTASTREQTTVLIGVV